MVEYADGLAGKAQMPQLIDRRTSVDVIFDHLYDRITKLELLPGEKISEAEIAASFGVSRQPVRDAFSRLANLDLLLIRPQKATEVRRFSTREITKSRFVRASVEAAVLRLAAAACDGRGATRLEHELAAQKQVVVAGDYAAFGRLDYQFHKILCEIANAEFAFEVIATEKSKVDRLCLLSLEQENRMPLLLEDHRAIAQAVIAGRPEDAVAAGMEHLSRLDATIAAVSASNAGFFDP
ncbi:GntR family transcriptional regulator [Paracoccus pacificus]|uniref:GntR family transcriptional regulator n=1 Tax=Paracoccus pacificus TaxID=1463598 RepID=A0ABW4R5Q5_9RHOB